MIVNFPHDRKYHADHLWAQDQPDGSCLIGVTDFAQDQLGGVTSRCIPFAQEKLSDTCIWCGKPPFGPIKK